MRVRTDLWVKAYLRAQNARGAFSVVMRHGDDEHGIVLIKLNRLDGSAVLFGPAPPSLEGVQSRGEGERIFHRMHKAETLPESDIDQLATREREFDPDIWIVETESREGLHGLDDWLVTPIKDR